MNQFFPSDMSVMKHTGTRALYDYWTSLRADRDAPRKAEISAQGVGRALAGNTFILESLGAGNMRFRLTGSELYNVFGLEMRGMSALSTMVQGDRARFRSLLETVLARPCVGVLHLMASTPAGGEVEAEMILNPLRSDFDEMNRVLGAIHLLQEGEIATGSRRCRIEKIHVLPIDTPRPALIDGPMAGFAEDPAEFAPNIATTEAQDDKPPALRTIEGGRSDDGTERRRNHLRLVKD